jgi:poly-gamma-glutamate capsule biosynthesis protein CapA/YwtB (metallophosphatase superfamily)
MTLRNAAAPAWLAATGDVVLHHAPTSHDERLRRLLTEAQVSFCNLEVPLTMRGEPAEKAATHRAHPDRAGDVRDLGFDVVTLANNHLLDFGAEGLWDTLGAVSGAGLSHVGAGADDAAARKPVLHRTHSGVVGFVGLCAALPPGFAATTNRPGVAPLRVLQQVSIDPALAAEQPGMAPFVHTQVHQPDLDAACAAVQDARATADLVVVGVHWGVPLGFAAVSYGALAEYQRPVGHALVDAGADLVVGHHPHIVAPVEQYRGALIAYSVGNYMFHSWEDFGPVTASADGTGATKGFVLQVLAAPYRSPFGAEETLDSVVLTLPEPSSAHGLVVRFVPTTMVDGDPAVPSPERSEAILRRLCEPPLDLVDGGASPALTLRHDVHPGMTIGEVSLAPRH